MTEFLQVYGYHGTSRIKAMSILNDGFRVSDNDYDWLGTGIYFFQDAPARAGAWAKEQYPENPVVICASIYLEGCMDLLDIVWFEDLKTIYSAFAEQYKFRGVPIPLQNLSISKAHRLDCAFF